MRQGILTFQLADGSSESSRPRKSSRWIRCIRASIRMLKVLNAYPAGNDPTFGEDGGLNFSGLRFNAPSHRDDSAIVGKIDLHLDAAGKHPFSVRGTLAHNIDDQILAQFPGQAPASTLRDNSKGFSAQYTAILKPHVMNSLNIGYTRFGRAFRRHRAGAVPDQRLDPLQNPYARPFGQLLPTLISPTT